MGFISLYCLNIVYAARLAGALSFETTDIRREHVMSRGQFIRPAGLMPARAGKMPHQRQRAPRACSPTLLQRQLISTRDAGFPAPGFDAGQTCGVAELLTS
jgi:hypothetical protein